MTRISTSPYLILLSLLFATIWLSFGFNALYRPHAAFSLFEFTYPISPQDQSVVNSLIKLYGVRDLFMGFVVIAAALFGSRKTLGCVLLAGAGVAVVDGVVVRDEVGRGEWNHWGYAPVVGLVGVLLVGVV